MSCASTLRRSLWPFVFAALLVSIPRTSDAQPRSRPHSVEVRQDDARSARATVTSRRAQQAIDASAGRTGRARLDRVRQQYSPRIRRLPSLPMQMRYGNGRDIDGLQQGMARLKSAARRYFDADEYRATARALGRAEREYLDNILRLVPNPSATYGDLDYADSLSVPGARVLDLDALSVRRFLYERALVHFGIRQEGNVVSVQDSVLGPISRVASEWRVGDPIVVYPTGSMGNDPNPLHTMYVVPVHDSDGVYAVVAFNAYSGHVMKSTVFGDDLALSRFPIMSLEAAEARVAESMGETPLESVYVNAYVDFLLPVPAVLTEEGSVYLVDPVVDAIW